MLRDSVRFTSLALRVLAVCAALALVSLAAPRAASAGPGDIALGLSFAGGGAVTDRAGDETGELTLLYGTGFTGSSLRIAGTAGFGVTSSLRVRIDLAWSHIRTRGYADAGELRRELTLSQSALEIPIGLQYERGLGPVSWQLMGGFGPRLGIGATATDERIGFESDEASPLIRVGTSVVAFAETGVAIDAGPVRVPIAFRVTYNLTYPNSTEGRLDGDGTEEQPGAYLVETDWTLLGLVGVEFGL